MAERKAKRLRTDDGKSTYNARQSEDRQLESQIDLLYRRLTNADWDRLDQDEKDMRSTAKVIADYGGLDRLQDASKLKFENRPYWQRRAVLRAARKFQEDVAYLVPRDEVYYHNQKKRAVQDMLDKMQHEKQHIYETVQNPFGTELPHPIVDLISKMTGNGITDYKKGFF